jgi:hypothetical protein
MELREGPPSQPLDAIAAANAPRAPTLQQPPSPWQNAEIDSRLRDEGRESRDAIVVVDDVEAHAKSAKGERVLNEGGEGGRIFEALLPPPPPFSSRISFSSSCTFVVVAETSMTEGEGNRSK